MTYHGKVKNGVVIFDGAAPADGIDVEVTPAGQASQNNRPEPSGNEPDAEGVALRNLLLSFAGKVSGLPSDLAAQHDHYLYGTPKR